VIARDIIAGGALGGGSPETASDIGRRLATYLIWIAWGVIGFTVIGGVVMILTVGVVNDPPFGKEVSPIGMALSLTATLSGIVFGLLLLAASAGLRLLADIRDTTAPR
jgi:hypothetical protein